jgi:hypothetical protein
VVATVTAVGSSNDGDGYGGGVCRSAQQRRPLGGVGCVDLLATATTVTAVGGSNDGDGYGGGNDDH